MVVVGHGLSLLALWMRLRSQTEREHANRRWLAAIVRALPQGSQLRDRRSDGACLTLTVAHARHRLTSAAMDERVKPPEPGTGPGQPTPRPDAHHQTAPPPTPTDADFSAFYREFVPTLVAFLIWLGAPLPEAADIGQETMLRARLPSHDYLSHDGVRSWRAARDTRSDTT